MSLYVDHTALEEITATCGAASRTVGEVGETVPLSVDAGDATALVLGIAALLLENGGELVAALATTGVVVAEINTAYRNGDHDLASDLTRAWTE